jgi:hypothetical protein
MFVVRYNVFTAYPFYPSQMFSDKVEEVEHLLGRLFALRTNIRLHWKGWPGTNTLAY